MLLNYLLLSRFQTVEILLSYFWSAICFIPLHSWRLHLFRKYQGLTQCPERVLVCLYLSPWNAVTDLHVETVFSELI